MSTEYIQVPGTSSQAPINIQITQPQKETKYSKKWIHKKITNDIELGNFIKSLFVQHDVVKGLFIPIESLSNAQPRDTDDDDEPLNKIKKQYAKFFNFTYNIVKNKSNSTIGFSVIKKLKSKSSKINVNSIGDNQEYLGAKCLTSSKKNSLIPPRKWKIQLMCKFTDTPETRDLLSELNSNILTEDYSLLLSEEICDDNNGPCSITKEPSNEILQYYNNIIQNTENLLKDKDTTKLGTFLPTIIEEIKLVVGGIPSVADIIVKLLSFSTFDECANTELKRLLSGINMSNVTVDTIDTADNKAKIIILLSLYDDNVDPKKIQEISNLMNPINQVDIMATIRNYIQQITLNSDDQTIKDLVTQLPTRIQEYQTNSSCQSKINDGLTEFNKSVSNNTTVANNFLSMNMQKAKDALGGATETINDAIPDVVKEPTKKIVENIIPTNTNQEDHDNFVKSILALLNTPTSDEVRNTPTKNENNEETNMEEKQDDERKDLPFGELVMSEKDTHPDEEFGKLVIGEKDEPFGELVIGEKDEPFGELMIGETGESFGELVIGEKDEQFGELVIGKKDEPFGELVIGKKDEPFGELVIGENDIGNKPI
jgi:hypothetical protein